MNNTQALEKALQDMRDNNAVHAEVEIVLYRNDIRCRSFLLLNTTLAAAAARARQEVDYCPIPCVAWLWFGGKTREVRRR